MTNPQTQTVALTEQHIEVLRAPMTYEQYQAVAGENGEVVAVVSIDYAHVFREAYESNLDYVASQVMGTLGDDWFIADMTVVGVDPRPRPDVYSGQRILLRVTLWPGAQPAATAPQLWEGVDTRAAFDGLSASALAAVEREVHEQLVPLRRLGHRPQVASPLEVFDSELAVVLLCTQCDGSTQLLFDTDTGAVADVEPDGGHNSDDRCAGAPA